VWVGACTAADSVLLAASDGLVTRFRTDDTQARLAGLPAACTGTCKSAGCSAAILSACPLYAYMQVLDAVLNAQSVLNRAACSLYGYTYASVLDAARWSLQGLDHHTAALHGAGCATVLLYARSLATQSGPACAEELLMTCW